MIRCMNYRGPSNRVDVLGVCIDDITEEDALEIIAGFIASKEPHRIVTPNPEIVMAARRNASYRSILNTADLAIPDGIGLLLAARMAGARLRAHVRGSDFVLRLAARSAQEEWRWFLLGAGEGVAQEAGQRLADEFPGLQIAGALAGSPDPAADAETHAAIRAAGPVHVLLVAYGAPRQERWIARNAVALGVPVQMGVGGVFNFLTGRSPRAPTWVRRVEMEWAYRLATEPWRWRRQLALPMFGALAAIEGARRWRSGRWGS